MITTIMICILLWSAVMIGVFAVATWASRKRERSEPPPMPPVTDVGKPIIYDGPGYMARIPGELEPRDLVVVQATFIGPPCPLVPVEQGKEYTITLLTYWNEKVAVYVHGMFGRPLMGYASRADFDADWAIVSNALHACPHATPHPDHRCAATAHQLRRTCVRSGRTALPTPNGYHQRQRGAWGRWRGVQVWPPACTGALLHRHRRMEHHCTRRQHLLHHRHLPPAQEAGTNTMTIQATYCGADPRSRYKYATTYRFEVMKGSKYAIHLKAPDGHQVVYMSLYSFMGSWNNITIIEA